MFTTGRLDSQSSVWRNKLSIPTVRRAPGQPDGGIRCNELSAAWARVPQLTPEPVLNHAAGATAPWLKWKRIALQTTDCEHHTRYRHCRGLNRISSRHPPLLAAEGTARRLETIATLKRGLRFDLMSTRHGNEWICTSARWRPRRYIPGQTAQRIPRRRSIPACAALRHFMRWDIPTWHSPLLTLATDPRRHRPLFAITNANLSWRIRHRVTHRSSTDYSRNRLHATSVAAVTRQPLPVTWAGLG